jgi:hypothetical protein
MRIYVSISLLALTMLFATFSSALSLNTTLSWSIQTVDENGAGGFSSIALTQLATHTWLMLLTKTAIGKIQSM